MSALTNWIVPVGVGVLAGLSMVFTYEKADFTFKNRLVVCILLMAVALPGLLYLAALIGVGLVKGIGFCILWLLRKIEDAGYAGCSYINRLMKKQNF